MLLFPVLYRLGGQLGSSQRLLQQLQPTAPSSSLSQRGWWPAPLLLRDRMERHLRRLLAPVAACSPLGRRGSAGMRASAAASAGSSGAPRAAFGGAGGGAFIAASTGVTACAPATARTGNFVAAFGAGDRVSPSASVGEAAGAYASLLERPAATPAAGC